MPNKLISQLSMTVCLHVIYEKLARCHISVVLVLLLQSFLPFPSNTSSPFRGFPEEMTGFPTLAGERESKKLNLGFLCQPLPRLCGEPEKRTQRNL